MSKVSSCSVAIVGTYSDCTCSNKLECNHQCHVLYVCVHMYVTQWFTCINMYLICSLFMLVPVSFVYLLRTFLKDCPFVIKVRATKDGQKLYIKEISGEHNHELSEVRIIVYVTNVVI